MILLPAVPHRRDMHLLGSPSMLEFMLRHDRVEIRRYKITFSSLYDMLRYITLCYDISL